MPGPVAFKPGGKVIGESNVMPGMAESFGEVQKVNNALII
jgi:hypothetical protein